MYLDHGRLFTVFKKKTRV